MSLNGLLERLQRRGPAVVMAQRSWASEAASPARYVDQSEGDHTAPTSWDAKVAPRVEAADPDGFSKISTEAHGDERQGYCKGREKTAARTEQVSAMVSAKTAIAGDRDRWAWPHSKAMNGAELDAITARLARFTDPGLNLADAEALADKLVQRDREADDRRACLECAQLEGHARTWGCKAWKRAGARDASLPGDLVRTLQRCDGFTDPQGPTTAQ